MPIGKNTPTPVGLTGIVKPLVYLEPDIGALLAQRQAIVIVTTRQITTNPCSHILKLPAYPAKITGVSSVAGSRRQQSVYPQSLPQILTGLAGPKAGLFTRSILESEELRRAGDRHT
jgi:hypothetical protein